MIPCPRCAGGGWVYAAGSKYLRECPSCEGRCFDDGLTDGERELEAMAAEIRRLRATIATLESTIANARHEAAVALRWGRQ